MKAIILSAGKGERLREFTRKIPKPMICLNGKPILQHNIERLKTFGISDIFINLHYLPEIISNYFQDGSKWGLKITYSYEAELLGTAGAVRKIAEDYWDLGKHKGNVGGRLLGENLQNLMSSFWVIYGDNLFPFDLDEIRNFHRGKGAITTIVLHKRKDVSQSGIVVLDNHGRIRKIIEKPKNEEAVSHWVNAGLYLLEPQVFKYIPPSKKVDFGMDVFPSMLQEGGKLFGFCFYLPLTAIDTPQLLKEALS